MTVSGRVFDTPRKTGFEVFAITNESAEHVRQFMTKNLVPIPVLLIRKRRVFEHHRISGLPHTIG